VLYAIAVLALLQLGFTYLPFMQHLFGTVIIGLNSWLIIMLVASSVLFLVELEKSVVRKKWVKKTGVSVGI